MGATILILHFAVGSAAEVSVNGLAPGTITPHCGDPSDCTAAIQAALNDASATTILFDNETHPYITQPLFIRRSNVHLVFKSCKVMLLAKRWCFNATGASLLSVTYVENITISGNGAAFRMWKFDYANPKYYAHAEWRMALQMDGAKHVLVEDLVVELSGGDGVYVGYENVDITLHRIHSRLNYRQGISVIDVDGLVVRDSIFESTDGTAPMAGVDFEPDTPSEQLTNILFENCIFRNNSGWQMAFALHAYNASSQPLSITMKNCTCDGGFNPMNGGVLVAIASQNVSNSPPGATLSFANLTVRNNPNIGFFADILPTTTKLSLHGLTVINNTAAQPAIFVNTEASPESIHMWDTVIFDTNTTQWGNKTFPSPDPIQVFPSSSWDRIRGNGVTIYTEHPRRECNWPHGNFSVVCRPV